MGIGDLDPVPLKLGLANGLALTTPGDLDFAPTGAAAAAAAAAGADDDEAALPESLRKSADPGGTWGSTGVLANLT
eukprot:6181036-Karenia_brevis.AAC.1